MIHLPLHTERLLLRDFEEADWEAVYCYASDPEVTRFMVWGPNTEEDTREYIQHKLAAQQADPRTSFSLAVVLKAEDVLIGSCALTVSRPEKHAAYIGYCLNRDYWGQGYATEAVQAIIGLGFLQLHLHRIFATCDPHNVASLRVLEKLGMRREGRLLEDRWQEGRWRDSYLYAILEQE